MRLAVFAVTETGLQLARRVRSLLVDSGADIYGKERPGSNGNAAPSGAPEEARVKPFRRLRDCVDANFRRYDALIFIMASGIAVRMIAPHVKDKLQDPAVIVMDERARHVISLLSGHVGGANLLARRLSEGLGADAVITTATDVEGLLAPDAAAMRLALRPRPREQIRVLNSALLEGHPISYYVDRDLPSCLFYRDELESWGIDAKCIPASELPQEGFRVFLTASRPAPSQGLLCLAPRRLIAGVGCRRGTGKASILEALCRALERLRRSKGDLSLVASTVVKKDEQGIRDAAAELGVEARFQDHGAMRRAIERYGLAESDFVKKTIGIGNVCEAAALSCVERGAIALPKTACHGVTVALVWER